MSGYKSSFVSFPGIRPDEVIQAEPKLPAYGPLCPDCYEPMVDDYRLGGNGRLVDPFCQTPACAAKKRELRGRD